MTSAWHGHIARDEVLMNRIVLALALLLPAAFCSAQTQPAAAAAELQSYDNADRGFSMKYPSDWKQQAGDKPNMVVKFIAPADDEADRFPENLNVIVIEMGQEADVNELVDEIKPTIPQRLEGYQAVSDEKITVAGKSARKLVGKTAKFGTDVVTSQWMFCAGTRFYIVTFTHVAEREEKYKALVKGIVDSLVLK